MKVIFTNLHPILSFDFYPQVSLGETYHPRSHTSMYTHTPRPHSQWHFNEEVAVCLSFYPEVDNHLFASTVKLGLVTFCFFPHKVSIYPPNTHRHQLPFNLETLTVLWSYTTLKTDPWKLRGKKRLWIFVGVLEIL